MNEMIVGVRERESGMVFTVCGLVTTEEIVRRKVISMLIADTFNDFGRRPKRKVGDRAEIG